MKRIDSQKGKKISTVDYIEYIKYLIDQGYSREQLTIDETSEIVDTRSLAKGVTGTVIDIRCPCRYKMIIAGREQLSEDAHALVIRLADEDNVEIAPDIRIKILKEKVSNAIKTVGTMFYKDLTITEYLKTTNTDVSVDTTLKSKSYHKFYRFNEGIEINGEEHLKIDVINPNIGIDSAHVKLGLDIDLWEEESY